MKKILIVISSIFLINISIFAINAIVATGEFPPYMSAAYKDQGYVHKILIEAFKLEGVNLSFKYYPWKRSYDLVLKGEADMTPFWVKTAERETLFFISDPIDSFKYVFFYLKSTYFDWKTVADLKTYKIGITSGYSSGKDIDDAIRNKMLTVDEAKDDEASMKKLLAGRVDVIIMEKMMALDLLKLKFTKEEIDMITFHPKSVMEDFAYLLVSKQVRNGKELVEKFNSGLKKLKQSGMLDKIVAGTY